MEFIKINYEELKMKPEDKVENSIIYTKNNNSNNSEVKRSVRDLFRKSKLDEGLER